MVANTAKPPHLLFAKFSLTEGQINTNKIEGKETVVLMLRRA
jgi:hypothetical protein